jgi:hypothetical protein
MALLITTPYLNAGPRMASEQAVGQAAVMKVTGSKKD